MIDYLHICTNPSVSMIVSMSNTALINHLDFIVMGKRPSFYVRLHHHKQVTKWPVKIWCTMTNIDPNSKWISWKLYEGLSSKSMNLRMNTLIHIQETLHGQVSLIFVACVCHVMICLIHACVTLFRDCDSYLQN